MSPLTETNEVDRAAERVLRVKTEGVDTVYQADIFGWNHAVFCFRNDQQILSSAYLADDTETLRSKLVDAELQLDGLRVQLAAEVELRKKAEEGHAAYKYFFEDVCETHQLWIKEGYKVLGTWFEGAECRGKWLLGEIRSCVQVRDYLLKACGINREDKPVGVNQNGLLYENPNNADGQCDIVVPPNLHKERQ